MPLFHYNYNISNGFQSIAATTIIRKNAIFYELFCINCLYKPLLMEEQKDQRLWRLAQKRASFKQNFYAYISINIVLWIIWWATQGRHGAGTGWPWPMWVTVFWGIAELFDYFSAYHSDKETLTEQEYKKLKKRQDQP
jgi:hypothetical protein